MLFNSYEFLLVFLPAAILICRLVDNHAGLRLWALIVLSLAFYGYWDVKFLALMIPSILVNWWAAVAFERTRKQAIIVAAIVGNLAVLGVFKYANFFAANLALVFGLRPEHLALTLPLGISFFTFHHIMYLVDLSRGRAPLYPLQHYALYICFFPQAISGPLARWSEVIEQFGHRIFAPGWERRCAVGATFIVLGLVQKTLLGDPIGRAIDPIYAQALQGPVLDGGAWMALAFAFQIFFDFAGYSDIAIGVALIFGVQLPRNFDGPYRAASIQDFWRRWHMTLSRFLRDYLYIPLGGNRFGQVRHIAALLTTMTLAGLWHGAGWTFVLWGALHGAALAFASLWRKVLPSPPAFVGWLLTITFVVTTFVLFRAGSLEAAWNIYQGLAVAPPLRPPGRNTLIAALVCAILLPPSHAICSRLTAAPRRSVAVVLAVVFTLILIFLGSGERYEFIYFQF